MSSSQKSFNSFRNVWKKKKQLTEFSKQTLIQQRKVIHNNFDRNFYKNNAKFILKFL